MSRPPLASHLTEPGWAWGQAEPGTPVPIYPVTIQSSFENKTGSYHTVCSLHNKTLFLKSKPGLRTLSIFFTNRHHGKCQHQRQRGGSPLLHDRQVPGAREHRPPLWVTARAHRGGSGQRTGTQAVSEPSPQGQAMSRPAFVTTEANEQAVRKPWRRSFQVGNAILPALEVCSAPRHPFHQVSVMGTRVSPPGPSGSSPPLSRATFQDRPCPNSVFLNTGVAVIKGCWTVTRQVSGWS